MPTDREPIDLLMCAIAQRSDNAERQQIDRLAKQVRDWDLLLKLAREHRVVPILFSRLASMSPAVPSAVRERLQAEYQRNVFHSLANAAELISLLKQFDREAIPAMPFKGVVLAASIYGDVTARSAGDLDILIHYRHLTRATAILLERGYELSTPVSADASPAVQDYYEYHFERPVDGMVVELRWRLELTQPRFRHNLGMDWVWPRRRIAILAGAEVPDMDPEIKLLVLCMHGSKHVWSRLIWICDVAQLLASFPGLDWDQATREAKRTGLWRALALGVLLAHRVAEAPVPSAVLRRFEADASALSLAQHIQEHLFEAPGSAPCSRIPYNIQLLGFRDRLRLFLSLEFLQPNERDRAVLSLPRALHALYYLVRPIRILLDRSAR